MSTVRKMSKEEVIAYYKDVLTEKRGRFPRGFWDHYEHRAYVVQFLIETLLKWTDEDILKHYDTYTLRENKLGGLFRICNCSPYQTLNIAYPGRFKPWELQSTALNTWNKENGILAVQWLIKKYNWSKKDVEKSLNLQSFRDAGLYRMMYEVFGNDVWAALDAAFPNKYKKADLAYYQPTWTREKAIAATQNLFQTLKWTEEDIKSNPLHEVFKEYKLTHMLMTVYDNNIYSAIDAAFPNIFKPWELNRVSKNFWNRKTLTEALHWFVDKYADGDPNKLTHSMLRNNSKFSNILDKKFDSSLRRLKKECFGI